MARAKGKNAAGCKNYHCRQRSRSLRRTTSQKVTSEKWLNRDFILSYFGKKYKTAQRQYQNFVNALVGQEYNSPFDEATASVLLGGQDFVDFIKKRYLTGINQSKDVPAVRALVQKVSIQDIADMVDQTMKDEGKMARNIKIFLCRKYTGQKLRTIGETFGIGDSAVTQVYKRFGKKIGQDKQLMDKIQKIERAIKASIVETPLCDFQAQ